MTMMRCDLSFPSHTVRGPLRIIPWQEIVEWSEAYAHFVLKQTFTMLEPDAVREAAIKQLIDMACLTRTDWAACEEHWRQWEAWKKEWG